MRRDSLLFTLFLLGTLLIHWPAHQAGFVSDFLGWQDLYNKGSFWGVFNSFGYGGHQQVLQLINYTMYKIFGTYGIPWYVLFCTMHAINGWLLYRFILKISELWGIPDARWSAVAGALFFLFSPYNPEATVWRVCLHYMISGMCTLGALLLTTEYLVRGDVRKLWWAHGLMLINLFTLELALAIPLLTHALVIGWFIMRPTRSDLNEMPFSWKQIFQYMTLPQAGLYAFFFLFNKLTLGQWVGHYGEARMLKFDYLRMLSTPLKYTIKHIGFVRNWAHPAKMLVFDFFSTPTGLMWGYGVLLSMVLAVLLFRKRLPARYGAVTLLLCMGILAALPVSNLHFEWVLYNENDRYGYLTSLFCMPALALLIAALPRWWNLTTGVLYLTLSVWLMFQTVVWWGEMERIYRQLLDEFKWYDNKEIVVMSMADDYRGIWMFRIYSKESALADALNMVKGRRPSGKITETAFFNMNSAADGMTATRPDPNGPIRVEFNEWGSWWWLAGLGANDYETDDFKVVFKDKYYELTPKSDHKDAVYIYQSGEHWKTLE
ncbi:MAG: hypothetical protein WCR52_16300 [Bacteroidota bacterium]